MHAGADLVGFGGAELGVEAERALPVAACPGRIPGGEADPAEAVAGTGLLVLIAGPAGQGERSGMPGAGGAGLALIQQCLGEPVERPGFIGPVAGLTE